MKMGLQKCAIITEKSCMKSNNNKLHSLQRYDIAQNYRILRKVIQQLSQHYLKMLYHLHIQKLRKKKLKYNLYVCP
jgi:hypothetical protein